MNQNFFLKSCISFMFVCLVGCQEYEDYNYLMTHPRALQKKIEICNMSESAQCKEVRLAADDFGSLVEEQNNDPEAFGQRIIKAQQLMVASLKSYEKAKASGNAEEIKQTNLTYQIHSQKLQSLYAVVALRSPE